jgi:hypothetical protein
VGRRASSSSSCSSSCQRDQVRRRDRSISRLFRQHVFICWPQVKKANIHVHRVHSCEGLAAPRLFSPSDSQLRMCFSELLFEHVHLLRQLLRGRQVTESARPTITVLAGGERRVVPAQVSTASTAAINTAQHAQRGCVGQSNQCDRRWGGGGRGREREREVEDEDEDEEE